MSSFNDLLVTIENLRKEKYPELPKELVEKILNIEADSREERSDISKKVEKVVESYLDKG